MFRNGIVRLAENNALFDLRYAFRLDCPEDNRRIADRGVRIFTDRNNQFIRAFERGFLKREPLLLFVFT